MFVWNWLVANGLFRDLLSAAILVPIMKIAGSRFAKRVGQEVVNAFRDVENEVRELERQLSNDDD
jgi:hypothetical protein